MPERIRIKDIAQLAGVSVGTVDRVLHGRTGVAESSRIKVEEILKKLRAILKSYMAYHLDVGKLKSEDFSFE